MENYHGDLEDIFRSAGASNSGVSAPSVVPPPHPPPVPPPTTNWPPFSSSDLVNLPPAPPQPSYDDHNWDNYFGDPFSNMRDPLLHQLAVANFSGSNSVTTQHLSILNTTAACGGGGGGRIMEESASSSNGLVNNTRDFFEDVMIRSPSNIFSRIQISSSPKEIKPPSTAPPPMISNDNMNSNSTKNCLLDNNNNNNSRAVQISSPRNLGTKRRKSQAKKVVCIPAPAAVNSRSSGEVVPSDLWAWRKYGQKPIKGSPYPRGYYRCSSSKGCSARKQVERSRTDPNMLVITYTSEHNHPWPTQRNALAGSTRSQPSKNTSTSTSTSISTLSSTAATSSSSKTTSQPKHTSSTDHQTNLDEIRDCTTTAIPSSPTAVKQETNKQTPITELTELTQFYNNKTPLIIPNNINNINTNQEDFFAELDEIETDHPLNNLLFTNGFGNPSDDPKKDDDDDPFNLFDWSADH